jgi:hypothetical protein
MTLPGETEAGSAGMQPCRGIAWWAHRNDVAGRGSSPFALFPKTHRIGRPLGLENPRPEGAEYSLTESDTSPFHAEPEQTDQANLVSDATINFLALGGAVRVGLSVVEHYLRPRAGALVPQHRYLLFLRYSPEGDTYDLGSLGNCSTAGPCLARKRMSSGRRGALRSTLA